MSNVAQPCKTSPSTMVGAGAPTSAAASTADTRSSQAHLAVVGGAQLICSTAQKRLRAAEEILSAAQARLVELQVEQDEAVDALVHALIDDGLSHCNPFATFGPLAPRALTTLPLAEQTKAIDQLVAAIQRSKSASKPTLQAMQAAKRAARAVDQALAHLDTSQAAVGRARHTRDALIQKWAAAVAAFRFTRRRSNR